MTCGHYPPGCTQSDVDASQGADEPEEDMELAELTAAFKGRDGIECVLYGDTLEEIAEQLRERVDASIGRVVAVNNNDRLCGWVHSDGRWTSVREE